MFAHMHITVLIRKHKGKAHLHHDQQRMEIPYDNGSNGKYRKYYKGYAYDTHPVRSPISLQQFLESPNQLIIFLRTHHTEPHIGRIQERKRGTVTNHKPLSYTTVKQHI